MKTLQYSKVVAQRFPAASRLSTVSTCYSVCCSSVGCCLRHGALRVHSAFLQPSSLETRTRRGRVLVCFLARFGTFRSQTFRSCGGRRRQVTPVVLLTVAKNNWVQGASLNIGSASTCVQRGQFESQLAVSRVGHTMCPSLACLLIKRTSTFLYFVPEA